MATTVFTGMDVCGALSVGLARQARLVLADLDGCLISEGHVYEDAQAFAAACGEKLWIVSNNSSHSAFSLSAELEALGVSVSAHRILLAGEQTLLHLQNTYPGIGLALFASECLQERARAIGLRPDSRTPEIAVLCRDPRFSLSDLDRLAAMVRRGVRLWVSNVDRTHPAVDGRPVPETGALLAALTAVLGEAVSYQTIGKPDAHMARLALQRAGIDPAEAIFVGDNPGTDGGIARNAGIPFVHLVREHAR
jgi:HAD superfamily hydrolase (TIGR01450 family)